VFLGGGLDADGKRSNLAWIYDLENDLWTDLPAMPQARNALACGYYGDDNHIVAAGGNHHLTCVTLNTMKKRSGYGAINVLDSTDMLDLNTFLWIPGPSLPIYLSSAATAPLYYDRELITTFFCILGLLLMVR